MGTTPSAGTAPGNRWLWIALGVVAVVIVAAVAYFLLNRSSGGEAQPSATPNVVAVASPSPSPLVSPSPSPAPETPSPVAAPASPEPSPSEPAASPEAAEAPSPTPIVIVVTATPESATPAPAPAVPAASPSPVASPAPAEEPASAPGGLGNPRSDFDATYGSPAGQTPNGLIVYRDNNFEYHAAFVPDLNGRSALLVLIPQSPPTVPLDQAQTLAHSLLPRDVEPPETTPEVNDQFAVEHFTSQLLAQALPSSAFAAGGGEPGQLLIVYQKNAQGDITRWMLGAGNDPNALIDAAGP